ncbi:phosphoglucosamine mutase [Leptolyngbya iicbica]|uniref:Phosphoglucosamine mutase n=2 Tax=Cyanophyceae TaxID=3028117 RepID=A0A4Q7ELV1_9CYAN|nr:phosphoglucosamine mutase [Leptolyngbya sp. LK]RZM82779.1 phosphoglucosamine mutase [Leptolyngbya sp. LK]
MVSTPARPASRQQFSLPPGLGWQTLDLPQTQLFGTDGIRGQAGELLNAPLATQIGYWAGQVLQQHYGAQGPILLGQDSRNSGHMLSSALAAGLTSAGLEVWNLGLCPTAAVANLTPAVGAIGGVMISASHNPPQDNGIKFFGPEGTKLPTAVQQHIERSLRGLEAPHPTLVTAWGQWHHRPELVGQYLDFLRQPLPNLNLSGLKIVLDMAWGAAAGIATQAFDSTQAEVIGIHGLPDGDRINVNCGSTHLEPLKAAVREHQADIGFAFDGDADRVIAVDGQGRIVDGDYILYFWGKLLKDSQRLPNNLIISTVMANLGFERAWNALGGELLRTQVGDQHVHAEMVDRGAKLGGEQSGHILCHHYSLTGDGILTALHLADLVQKVGGSLAALVDQSFTTYPQRLDNIRVEDRDRRKNWQACDPVVQAIAQAEADMGALGRVLVRPSGTEPLIRVMVEAEQQPLVDHWTDHIAAAVRQHLAV